MAHLANDHRRDVWVLDLRSSCGMPTATHPWAFEDMGCEDIPFAIDRVCAATGAEQVDLVTHCMGSAMLFMGLLGRNEYDGNDLILPRLGRHERLRRQLWKLDRPPCKDAAAGIGVDAARTTPVRGRIRRLVMSQVGPVVRVTPANIARSYLMRYAQQFIGAGYRFRTDEDEGKDKGEVRLADELIDRLLAALPYPPGEFKRENPFWPPGQHLGWVGSRHRIDALFGRVFNLANMDKGTLDSIDDFFGPFSVDTVSQVMYFARYWMITDRSGFNRFVSADRLRERLTFPMLSLHAAANGLADVATKDLLERLIEPNLGVGGSLTCVQLTGGGLGHQDSLIGNRKATQPALAEIARFLNQVNP
jgi:hypothetical protein